MAYFNYISRDAELSDGIVNPVSIRHMIHWRFTRRRNSAADYPKEKFRKDAEQSIKERYSMTRGRALFGKTRQRTSDALW